jgi:hypothetical protein
MTYRIETHSGRLIVIGEEYPTLDAAREAIAERFGGELTDDMKGACPDEDGLIGVECWMPYLDDDYIPDGTCFVYRVSHEDGERR